MVVMCVFLLFQLPKVNFEKYGVSIPEFVEEEQKPNDNMDMTVRGRMFDQSKPETFNQVFSYNKEQLLNALV